MTLLPRPKKTATGTLTLPCPASRPSKKLVQWWTPLRHPQRQLLQARRLLRPTLWVIWSKPKPTRQPKLLHRPPRPQPRLRLLPLLRLLQLLLQLPRQQLLPPVTPSITLCKPARFERQKMRSNSVSSSH